MDGEAADISELIAEARLALKGALIPTPLVRSDFFSAEFGCEVFLKLENLQKTGSFKARGAYNRIRALSAEEKRKGVITASSGNHAQGVAWAATLLGVTSTVVMPASAALSKRVAAKGYGANIIFHGKYIDEALTKAEALSREKGAAFIRPYDDELVIAGQGTIGLEILDALPDADTVVVPVGGGGLISGIASAIKAVKPDTEIVGVEAAGASSCVESLKEGRPVETGRARTIADGIAVKKVGGKTFPIIKRLVNRVVTVSEDSLAEAVLKLMERKKLVSEGAGAAPLAAVIERKVRPPKGRKLVLVVSGGNIDAATLDRVIRRGLVKEGRVVGVSVVISDEPGALAAFTSVIAAKGANILDISNSRDEKGLEFGAVRVRAVLECEGIDHAEGVIEALETKGYEVKR